METQSQALSLSIPEMIANSGLVVQLVLLVLLAFSVLTWAIIIFKWSYVKTAFASTEDFLDIFWSGKSMDFIYNEAKKFSKSPIAKQFQAGYVELQRLIERERQKAGGSAKERFIPPESAIFNLERSLNKAERNQSLRLERSLNFLATTGSTAPFIGLFGTVWGIMNAFKNIGVTKSASLDAVAPGIAEALIATAVGLAAAIPAVMAYNYYAQKVRSLRMQMDNFSGDFLNIIKRNFLTA